MSDKPRLYMAAPLFPQAERDFNLELKRTLSAFFKVYLPQEDGELLTDPLNDGDEPRQAMKQIFAADLEAIQQADFLDGRTIDEGACGTWHCVWVG